MICMCVVFVFMVGLSVVLIWDIDRWIIRCVGLGTREIE